MEAIIEASCIAADPENAQATAESAASSQGVWIGQSNDHGIKDIHIRTEAPNAIWFDASVDRIADNLRLLGDETTRDIRRARAVGVIAQPQRTLDLYAQAAATDALSSSVSNDTSSGNDTVSTSRRIDPRPPATLYVHLAADALSSDADGTAGGAARLEEVGAVTLGQVQSWLGGCSVTVKPVIDLAGQAPVDGYEVPDRLREAVHLRSPVDIFPYANSSSRNQDVDHTDPYVDPDEGGPPGQTRLSNLGPMTRFHHRIKTHGRWRVRQPFPGIFIWRSPRGRYYLVDHTGTQRIHKTAA
ncbi:MAG: HNH endonuclease signature motif containing protein [Nocardioidaceae bacterium]